MRPRYFCTLFDKNYLLKGLAMLKSLHTYGGQVRVFVLCMDAETELLLKQLDWPFITCISLVDLEDETLLKVKPTRTVAEYCWTLSPCLPWYLMQHYEEIDFITYLDADLLFYSDIQVLFDEIGDASIAIIEHRFPPWLKDREANGRFCVEWVSFKRDVEGLACLQRWREQCIDWCYYRLEEGKMGDQKYLDEWPSRYAQCHILQTIGAGVAPWNYSQYQFGQDGTGAITVNQSPLIFYHFHQFEILNDGHFYRLSNFYTKQCQEPSLIYQRYEEVLKKMLVEVRLLAPNFSGGIKQASDVKQTIWKKSLTTVLNRIKKLLRSQ